MSQTELTRVAAVAMPTRRRAFDPALLLWIVLAAVLIFLVVNPLFRLVQLSLEDTDTGAFTLMNYVTAYSRQRYITATWNSLRSRPRTSSSTARYSSSFEPKWR